MRRHLSLWEHQEVQKPTYRVIPRKGGRSFDVEMTAPNSPPTIVNCFNTEAEAWGWVFSSARLSDLRAG